MTTSIRILLGLAISAFVLAPPLEAKAQDAVADFYKGKTVTIVIGSTPGGGYDTYARLIARHIGKYIPGHPAVVPSNMPGAGSNVAAAAVYNTLPKDGTVIGAIYASAMLEPRLDRGFSRHPQSLLRYQVQDRARLCRLARGSFGD